jgi:hypothetical protein
MEDTIDSINVRSQKVFVRWRDSNRYILQEKRDDDFTVEEIETCGFLIKENSNQITVAQDLVGEEDVRGVIVIPRENIKEVIYFKD